MSIQSETRIAQTFKRARSEGRAAFIAYLTGGDPTPGSTVDLILALEASGVDVIELGVPFSDPVADGPVIQRASERSLRGGTTVASLLKTVVDVRRSSNIPIVLFSYLNPLLRFGFDRLASEAVEAGIDGVLMTDLSVEEADEPVSRLRNKGLDTVFLGAPTSSDRRLALAAQYSSGFLYLVSRTGVTGERQSILEGTAAFVRRARQHTALPLAVGFGISTPEQVKQVGTLAEGVVVGSALVRYIEENQKDPHLPMKLAAFTRVLTAPLQPATAAQ